jgi:hypothetical protein
MTIYLLPAAGRTNGTSMIRFAKSKCKEVCQLASTAVATLALLVATGNFAEAGSSRHEKSVEAVTSRTAGEPIMAIVSLRVSGLPYTMLTAESCERLFPAGSRDAKRRLGFLALFRRTLSTTQICMMMLTCPTCSGLRSRALLCTVAFCRDIRPRMVAFVCRMTLPHNCSISLSWACA